MRRKPNSVGKKVRRPKMKLGLPDQDQAKRAVLAPCAHRNPAAGLPMGVAALRRAPPLTGGKNEQSERFGAAVRPGTAKMAPPERGQVVGGRYPFTGDAMVTESGRRRKFERAAMHSYTRREASLKCTASHTVGWSTSVHATRWRQCAGMRR